MTWAFAASSRDTTRSSATGTPAARNSTLAIVLLHGHRRGHDTRMRVRDAEDLEEALERAVLAGPTVKHVERDVGLGGGQSRGDVAADVDRRDPIAAAAERIGAGLAGAQRNVPLGRPAPHQNGDVLAHSSPLGCLQPLIRWDINRIDYWRKIESSQRPILLEIGAFCAPIGNLRAARSRCTLPAWLAPGETCELASWRHSSCSRSRPPPRMPPSQCRCRRLSV